MTIQELIDSLSGYYITIIVVLISIPLMSFLLVLIQKDGERNQRKLLPLYGTLIYLSCIPGIAASVLTAYSVFFIQKSLLQLSLPIYILPILSMIATLMIIKKKNHYCPIKNS